MVYELKNSSELKEYVAKNQLAIVAIADKNKENLWQYVENIFSRLERSAKPAITFAIIHYQAVINELKSFEVEQAQKSVIIKLFLNGICVFEQEGLIGSKISDELALKKGIKETLKLYSINVRFVTT